MTTVQFYHLTTTPIERALPKLLEKAYSGGYRALVVAASDEQAEQLNQNLWTYEGGSFLPHGTAKDGDPELQPIFLSTTLANPNQATALFVTEGSVPPEPAAYKRIVDLFDGNDANAVAKAAARKTGYAKAGLEISYLQQNASGGWDKAA